MFYYWLILVHLDEFVIYYLVDWLSLVCLSYGYDERRVIV
jgi:hypothetical protein